MKTIHDRTTDPACMLVFALCLLCVITHSPAFGQAGPIVGFQRLRLDPGASDLETPFAPFPLAAGLVTGVNTDLLVSDDAQWETNQWAEHQALLTAATGEEKLFLVTGNTATHLQVTPDPLSQPLVLLGAQLQVLPNLEDDFGYQLSKGDAVGLIPVAAASTAADTPADPKLLRKESAGLWVDEEGHAATFTLHPRQLYRFEVTDQRDLILDGQVIEVTNE